MQGVEKHVLPILIIILVLVALISTYAWFSSDPKSNAIVEIGSGEPTSFAITDGSGQSSNGIYHYGGETPSVENMYNGQIGYNESGVAYADDNAPFRIYPKIPFAVSGTSTMRIVVNFDKLIVTVGTRYTYDLDQTLEFIIGLDAADIALMTSQQKAAYYVTTTAYASDASTLPTSGNSIYFIYNESTSKVVHLIYTSEVVQDYMTYDYWSSSEDAVEPVNNHGSGKTTGYIEYVSDGSGDDAYMCVMIGFYGYDSVNQHYTPCAFSGNKFRGSSFTFIMSAGGV